MFIYLEAFHKSISAILNKPDYKLLAARHAASLQEEIGCQKKEIQTLYFALQEVCKYAYMVEGTIESKNPQYWIQEARKKYYGDIEELKKQLNHNITKPSL